MRVAITGSEGFIGSRLADLVESHRDEILGIDLDTGQDIREPETAELIREFAPEVVYHLAALHVVPWCREHPEETLATNVQGFANVLKGLETVGLLAVVLASSAAVYGFGPERLRPDDPLGPVDVYGLSKVDAEGLLREFSKLRPHVSCTAARLSNVVGRGDTNPHVLPDIAASLRHTSLLRLGNLDVERDYLHVDDAAAGLYACSQLPEGFRALNISTGIGTTVAELVDICAELTGREIVIDSKGGRSTDGDLVCDNAESLRQLWWQPRFTVRDAVREALA